MCQIWRASISELLPKPYWILKILITENDTPLPSSVLQSHGPLIWQSWYPGLESGGSFNNSTAMHFRISQPAERSESANSAMFHWVVASALRPSIICTFFSISIFSLLVLLAIVSQLCGFNKSKLTSTLGLTDWRSVTRERVLAIVLQPSNHPVA